MAAALYYPGYAGAYLSDVPRQHRTPRQHVHWAILACLSPADSRPSPLHLAAGIMIAAPTARALADRARVHGNRPAGGNLRPQVGATPPYRLVTLQIRPLLHRLPQLLHLVLTQRRQKPRTAARAQPGSAIAVVAVNPVAQRLTIPVPLARAAVSREWPSKIRAIARCRRTTALTALTGKLTQLRR
jgi:hypothetical protein